MNECLFVQHVCLLAAQRDECCTHEQVEETGDKLLMMKRILVDALRF